MSGICAVWQKDRHTGIAGTVAAVTAGLSLSPVERSRSEVESGTGLGVQARFPDCQQTFRNHRLLLACDAELLNERELWDAAGDTLSPARPAALLAALYERYGESFVERLRGGFSVILWDIGERRLFAAVDRFGIKRLAWYNDDTRLVVASRATAVRRGAAGLSVNSRAIANVINFAASLAPETVFKGVRRLEPGMVIRGV